MKGPPMGLIRRILGLETRPGEPRPLGDRDFGAVAEGSDRPVFVLFFSLWCSACQVMGGLLNEVGPDFTGRADFYRIDASKNPASAAGMNVRSVPTVIAISKGGEIGRATGLMPIDELRDWIEDTLAYAREKEEKD